MTFFAHGVPPRARCLLWLAVLFFMVTGLMGCAMEQATRPAPPLLSRRPAADETMVSVFMNFPAEPMTGIWVQFASLELVGGNAVLPLSLRSKELETTSLSGRQRLLAQGPVGASGYQALRVVIEKAALVRDGRKMILSVQQPVVDLPLPAGFQLRPGESVSLFVYWSEEGAIQHQALFTPRMTAVAQQPPLVADLAYVSCPEIDTVFTIRTDRNWVTGSFSVAGEPTYLAYSSRRKHLYVLSRKTAEITVVRAATSQTLDRFKIPLIVSPAFMMSPEGDWGYILDEESNYILRMNLAQGTLDQRARVGFQPGYAAWVADSSRLAVLSKRSQQVYMIEPETLATVASVVVGSGPQSLLAVEGSLYVAEGGANTVSIYDIGSLQPVKRMNVGPGPRRLLLSGENIYVTNGDDGTISLLLMRQQRLSRAIRVEGRPFAMAASTARKWLYVGDEEFGRLSVIDQTSNRVSERIELGAIPMDILLVQ